MPQQRRRPSRERIVDAALELAERDGWEAVRLHQVAAACDAGLDDIRRQFREKDEIVDAWLDRADAAMLRHFDQGGVDGLPPRECLRQLIMVWLEALARHQRVTREMVAQRLEPGHVHAQLPAILRVGRTVRWLREGAMLDAPLPRRAFEETALMLLFVETFLYWLRDDSTGFRNTRQWLDRGLYVLETLGRCIPGGRFGGEGPLVSESRPASRDADGGSDREAQPQPSA